MSAYPPQSRDSHGLYAPQIRLEPSDETDWLELFETSGPSPANLWVPDEQEENFQSQPGIPSSTEFSNVIVENDDEITIQSKRHETQAIEADEEEVAEPEPKKPGRQVRILDEWSPLPGEASYATVKLNQEKDETYFNERKIPENSNPTAGSNTRVLDESQVLPGEASFATVIFNRSPVGRSWSPLNEFRAKTGFKLGTSLLVGLSLVAVVFISLSIFLAFELLNNHPVNEPAEEVAQAEATQNPSISEASVGGALPNQPDDANFLNVKEAGAEGIIENPKHSPDPSAVDAFSQVPSISETVEANSKQERISNSESAAAKRDKRQELVNKSKRESETKKPRGLVVEESTPKDESPKPVVSENESSAPKVVDSVKEPPKPVVVVGEGVRPRRVMP